MLSFKILTHSFSGLKLVNLNLLNLLVRSLYEFERMKKMDFENIENYRRSSEMPIIENGRNDFSGIQSLDSKLSP